MKRQAKQEVLKKSRGMSGGACCSGRWACNFTLIVTTALFLCATTVLAQGPKRTELKAFYQQNCSRCHGPDGSATGVDGKKLKGQDFTDQEWQRNTEDAEMVKTILNGKFFGLAMPKFKHELTEEEAQWMATDIIRNSKKGQVIAPEGQ